MEDVFIEHMVKRGGTAKAAGIKLLIVFSAVLLSVVLLFATSLIPQEFFMFIPVLFMGVWWGVWILLRRQNIEYEYIVTNGELDVDKIMGRNSRKRLLSVDCRGFDILAPVTEKYAREYQSQSITKRVDASSSPSAPGRYFAVFNGKDGARTLLVFEPNERMMKAFEKVIPRKIQKP